MIEVPKTRPRNGVVAAMAASPIHCSTNRSGVRLCASPRYGVRGRICWLVRRHLERRLLVLRFEVGQGHQARLLPADRAALLVADDVRHRT